MDYQQAFNILELNPKFTKHELKKAYHLKCLQYHPDKNKDGEEMFKHTLDAYHLLNKLLPIPDVDYHNKSYKTLLRGYIETISTKYGWDKTFILSTFTKILCECHTLSFKIFASLPHHKMIEIYDYISKYSIIFHIDQKTLDTMKQLIIKKEKGTNTVLLHPTLEDIFKNNIYKLERNNKQYYIPLWHNEVYFSNNLQVQIVPDLSSNICIDEDNNLHVYMTYDVVKLLNQETLHLRLGNQTFETPTNRLLLRKIQTIIFSKQGISKINTDDLFKVDDKSDVIITLHLRCIGK